MINQTVEAEGELANVIIGIGTNGTFERGGVPLVLGENVITATGRDIHGNAKSISITLTGVPLEGPQIAVVSGDLQQGMVNTQLQDPLIVQITHSNGSPFVNKVVNFEVTRSNGRLSDSPDFFDPDKMMVQVRTNNNGEAAAFWTLGSDAGCGNNRIAVTSRDIAGTIFFCASADPAPARQINIGSGNNQVAEAGATAPELLRVWVNDMNNGVSNIPVTFTVIEGNGKVNGLDTVVANTSITGHAQVELTLGPNNGNNVIEAEFPGNSAGLATFTIVGVERDLEQQASFSGLVLDNSIQPIEGAECVLEVGGTVLPAVHSDAEGRFVFTGIPDGPAHFHVDGLVATAVGGQPIAQGSFPALEYELIIVPNAENSLPTPVLLPALNPNNAFTYDGTEDIELTVEGIDGLKMMVKAGSMRRADGSEPSSADPAIIALNQVHFDDIPMPMPDGAAPPFAWTLQPAGATFAPPVEIFFPNMEGLSSGTITYFLSFDHDINQFVIISSASVSDDGNSIQSDPGSGISKAGWGGPRFPPPPTGDIKNEPPYAPAPKETSGDPIADNLNNPEPSGCPTQGQNKDKKEPSGQGAVGDPIYPFSGEFYEEAVDLRIKGRGFDFVWKRKYRSKFGMDTAQGNGWDFSYNLFLQQSQDDILVCNGNARIDRFRKRPFGFFTRSEYFRFIGVNPDSTLTITLADNSKQHYFPFDGSAVAGKIASMVDRNGNTMTFSYDVQGRLATITDTLDRDSTIDYNTDGFIESVTDFIGRKVRYDYYQDGDAGGSFGDLKSVISPAVTDTPNGNDFPNGKTTTYTYSKGFSDDRLNHNLLTITDGRRNDPNDPTFGDGPYVINEYASTSNPNDFNFDRVVRQIWGGDIIDLTYIPQVILRQAAVFDPDRIFRPVTKTIVNDRNGNVKEYFYDVRNRLVREIEYTGTADPTQPTTETENRPVNKFRPDDPEFFSTTYFYNNDAMLKRTTFPNGNEVENVHEADLNPDANPRSRANVRIVRKMPRFHQPAGDQAVIEEFFEYDTDFGCSAGCGFNFVTRHVDGRGNETLSDYDDNGNLIHRQHRISSIIEDFEYNQFGQMTAHTWPDNGSNHRRRDEFTYYGSGPQSGYMKDSIIDGTAAGFFLKCTDSKVPNFGVRQ